MKAFQLHKTNVVIEHLNIRKEGPDDDRIPAIDIKLTAEEIDGEILAALIGCEDASWTLLWDHDEERNPRFWNLGECKSPTVLEGRHELVVGVHRLRPTKIGKFVFTVRPGQRVDLTFSVSLVDPPMQLVELLAERLKDTIPVDVIPDPDLFEEREAA